MTPIDIQEIIEQEMQWAIKAVISIKIREEIKRGAEDAAARIARKLSASQARASAPPTTPRPALGCDCGAERAKCKHANWCQLSTGRRP